MRYFDENLNELSEKPDLTKGYLQLYDLPIPEALDLVNKGLKPALDEDDYEKVQIYHSPPPDLEILDIQHRLQELDVYNMKYMEGILSEVEWHNVKQEKAKLRKLYNELKVEMGG